ncbi:hypothetical protein Trydic_g2554 [Trypoxylus dichotomus]
MKQKTRTPKDPVAGQHTEGYQQAAWCGELKNSCQGLVVLETKVKGGQDPTGLSYKMQSTKFIRNMSEIVSAITHLFKETANITHGCGTISHKH